MTAVAQRLLPGWSRGYRREWAVEGRGRRRDAGGGGHPGVHGLHVDRADAGRTGLYTVIFPTLVFALLGSSRLLVVGADSATAAILAAGLAGLGIAGLTPNSSEWVAWTSLVALVCGGMLLLARLLRLGFLGDFLSASVLIGFLTGVGIQVIGGQIPDMLGMPKGTRQLARTAVGLDHATSRRQRCRRSLRAGHAGDHRRVQAVLPEVPGAVVAVVLSIIISAASTRRRTGWPSSAVAGRLPADRPAARHRLGRRARGAGIAFACFVLIIAQSAATSRCFAMRHGERVDVNRDIVGLPARTSPPG